jgi:hypothetical protein
MKPIETEQYKGITINIHSDDSPSNPFEEWDCEPPLLTYYGGRGASLKAYQNAPERWGEILALLPDSCFERGKRMELIKQLNCTLREFAEENRNMRTIDAFVEFLTSQCGAFPSGWGDAVAWFEMAEWILNWGGITAVYEQSTGHCQGDVTLCLAIATPDWLKLTGVDPENAKEQLERSIELYGNWAWGNVYGFTCEDENGDDVGHGCWGFYGYDHEKSGLMAEARSDIDQHLKEVAEMALKEEQAEREREAAQAKEAANLTAAFTF